MGVPMQWMPSPRGPGFHWYQPTYSRPEVVEVFVTHAPSLAFHRCGREQPQPVLPGVGRWAGPLLSPDKEG